MMNRLKTWITKRIAARLYTPESVDMKKVMDWLWSSYANEGFKHYYTMRKRQIVNILIVEDDQVKRAEARGRLSELGALAANVADERKRREAAKKT
jgi:hypothetical protein